ncbi:MAG: exodeoxyribonuclease VII large subunit, partial [Eubacteriales bacterium]|nr:exodeoxyribonuclease VII large subunit [Eubacteriales bacterium]
LPKGIGIATSGTGAVIHDIMRVAWRRDGGMPLYLYPVAVQGDGAAEQIARALKVLDTLDAIDVIIVGRGGGSMEDLWPFNEEIVARAIAACRKPVVSAVGHETDFTIADFVADVRAPTPSAAAELAVPERDALLAEIEKLAGRLKRAAEAEISDKSAQVAELRKRLAEQTPENQLRAVEERLKALGGRLTLLANAQLNAKAHRLEAAHLRLTASGPAATLQRGYALIRQNGRTIQSVAALDTEQLFTVTLKDGWIDAKAEQIGREERQ